MFFEAKEDESGIDSIAYAYSQNKTELMRFIVSYIDVFGLDDPDFINYFVFSSMFRAPVFKTVLDTLRHKRSIVEPHISVLDLFMKHLLYKARVDPLNQDVQEAIKMTQCEIMSQYVNLYYILCFSMNGKFAFDPYFQLMTRSNKTDMLDTFIQFMGQNTFVYLGSKEYQPEKEADEDMKIV